MSNEAQLSAYKVAVFLPCYNEQDVIAKVIGDFKKSLPKADVFVIDNNSTDSTSERAAGAGAIVYTELMRGKGNAVRRAFAEIDADIYLMADGDGTYDASRAEELVQIMIDEHLDMVIGTRFTDSENAYRSGHRFGNLLFNKLITYMFGDKFSDVFSGYRVFSRRFAKTFPALSSGFEIETEMSVHAIQLQLPTTEVKTDYFDRLEGSQSKLNTYRDGFRILFTMLKLVKHVRPMALFSVIGGFLMILSLAIGVPVVLEFLETHLVPRLPTAVAAMGLMVLSAISFVTGIILNSISFALTTTKRLAYLSYDPGPKNRDKP